LAEQNINTNITATANFTSLTAQLRAVTAELIKLQATTIGLDRNLSNEVGRMNRSFADTMRATGQFSSHFVTLESDVQKFGKRLDTGRMKLGEYFGVWQGHTRKTSTLIKDLAKQQVLMEQAVMQPLGRNAQGQMQYNVHVANGLDVLKNRTALLRQEASILNKVMLDGSNQLINWGKNTQWAGRQLTVGLTVPMMAFGAAAQKAFLEADQQLVRLTKVYGGLAETSSAELKQVRKDVEETAKELASIYGASYKETIALAADIAATGKQGNDLLVSTQETTRLSILGEVDRQDAMKATLAIQNAFKQSNEELAGSINFLNAVENQTSTSLADLVEAIPKAGPVIQSLGGDVQDLALYLTAMKEGGVNASEGANAIKSSLASLINPTKVAREMFMGFGIDLGSIVKNNAGDITATILALQASLDKLDPLQKAQAIEQLFGKFQFARMGALFNNLGKEGSQTLQVLDLMKASTEELAGIADRELKAMTESASGQYKRALETIKAELAGVGDQFLKISTFVLKTISGIIKFVENLPGPIKSLLTFLGGLTAFAGPLIMLTGVLGNFLGYIIKGVFHLKQLFKGGSGFKLLTPEMMAAAEAGKIVEKSFFSDAQAAIALETAVNNLAASFDRLKTSALNSAVATSSSVSTMGGSTILSPAGAAANADRMADKDSKFIGAPFSRQFAHTIPTAIEQPGTIFGVVPNPGPVNVRVSNNPQMYMDQDLPRIPGVTSISGVSTGIVAGEAAKWHAMTAAIATQSQAELTLLKTEVAATGTVTHELSSVYQQMLPQMQQLTSLAADEGAMIVRQLQQGVITVEQARARIISLNATIEIMMAETAAQVAAGMGRSISLTTVPFTGQPVVDPVTGKSNMKEMFHKPETAALVDDVARGLGVRTSGGGYSIETTKPRIILPKRGPSRGFNDGGYVYTLADGPVVPGDKNVNYDNTMAKIPTGGFVLNQEATRNNPQLVEYAKKSKPYNSGGMIDAMLTPYETVFTPEQTQEVLPILEAANNGQRIQFRNAGGILGGPIVNGKHNYGRFDLLKSLFRRKKAKSADDLASLSPQIKLGRGHRTSADDAHDYVEGALGSAAPRRGILGNRNGYFFVGNWGLNTRKTTNSKINAGAAKPQEIIDDIMSLPPSEALPALRRFLKVNKVDDDLAERLVLEARDGIVGNISAHGDSLIGEKLFAQAQHSEYLRIAEQLGLRKKYIDSLNIPGQRRGFREAGDTKSGFKGATAISPYGTNDLDTLIAKNDEFGTSFMGSYETYNTKGLKVNGEDGAFAHMQLDEFAMGGIIKKRKANYGRLFLGMPKSIKQVQEQRKRREVMEQTTEAVNKSRFAKEEPTNFGKKEEDTKGHSFPVEGVGGVYTKPDGTRVFVKPVLDETAALAEQRYNAIHQGPHRLTTPQQEIKVMLDPTDPAGKRKLLVLESPYDPRFASLPKEMSEQEYFQQLLASALRGDKDLSPGNIGGSFVADGGTMGVFKTASGLRSYADDMPSVAEQARINLLGVKGGAKRFFAESTVDIPRGMTPQQYHQSMLNEIDEVLPRLKETIAGFKGLTPREEEVYAAMIKRLEDARHVNWKEFHGIHSAVKPTAPKSLTPAALAKLEEAAALRARQKGHAASLSDMAFKSDANGFNGGGLINVIKSLAMRRIGAGFGKNTSGGWGVTSLEIGMAEKLFASSGLTKRTQRILYDKFAEALAKEMPYGYSKNAQGQLLKALEPDIMDSVIRSAASSTISAPEGRKVLSAIDRDILKRRYTNWESRKDTPLTEELKKLIFGLEAREKGGPVSGGTPYIVGEKGPELFVPMNNGGIIPNYALGGMIRDRKHNYGALGPVAGIVAQQALPLAAFMLLPKALEKLGIASEKSNLILNGIFAVMTAGSIYKGIKTAKAAKAGGAVGDATAAVAAERNVGKFGQTLGKLNAAGKAIPGWGKVAIFALTTLATVSYGAWENARKARLASQEALDVNEIQAKQLGITYTSLTDKIKKATEAAKAQGELAKIKAAGSTAIGGGINMSVKELNALQKKAKETQGDIVQMFNNLDENDVTKAATALKVQLVAAGKSAQEAAKEIYSIISVSNKAAQATAAVSSSEFLRVVDRASAARVAIETFVKSIEGADVDKKEIAASFSGGLDAIQLYYQSLVGIKDETGKAKTQTEALNDTIEQMNANKNNQKDIGDDILNLLVKENPLYKDILNSNDSMVDAWAKIQLYTNGVTANLSGLSGQEAQDLLQVVTAISQAASEMTTNANLLNNPLDAIADYGTAAKLAYDKAKKASDDATKNAQKNADAEIKALDKKIEKINEEADARIRAIEDQAEKQDYLTEVQKEQLNYQQALLAGDMSRAAQSQLNIQGLTNERQKTLSINAIQDKRDAEVKKLEQAKAAVQERLIKLQEKANKLQEIANIKQKEYASIQALQQSIATTISKAGMTTDEGVLGTLAKALQSDVAALAAINSEGAAAAKTVTAGVPMTAAKTVTGPKGLSFQQPGTADWLTYLKKITNDPGGADNSAVEYAEKYFDGFGEHVDSFGMYVKKLLGLPEVGEANAFANAKGAPIKLTFDKKTGNYIDSSGKVYKESERFFMPKPAEDTPGGAQYKSFKHPIAANRGTTIREEDGRAKFKDYTDPKTGYVYTADGRVTDKNAKIIGRWASENYASNPWDKKVVSYNKGGKVKYFEPGGKVSGPGTGTSDSIPAMLSNGEYVIKADSVSKYGIDTFDALNAQKLAGGGAVGLGSPAPINSGYLNLGGMIPRYHKGGPAGHRHGSTTEGVEQGGKIMGPIEAWQDANKQIVKIKVPPITANFDTNSYTLNKEQKLELQAIAKYLIKHKLASIVVEGHTDSVGKGKDNQILSQNRANAIAEYMSKFVPGTAFTPVGYGEYSPLVPNTTSENKAMNRRAELFLPDKYKTIYPDYIPENHEYSLSKGRLDGGGEILGLNGKLSSGSIQSTIDWGRLLKKIKSGFGFHRGGLVHPHRADGSHEVSMSALSPAKAAANSKATDKFYEKNPDYYKDKNGEWVKRGPSLWETFTTAKNWPLAFGKGHNPSGPIYEESRNILLTALAGPGAAERYNDGRNWRTGEYLSAAVNIALARVGGIHGNALMRTIVEGFGASKGIPNLGHLLPKGSLPFLGASGSKFATNAATAAIIGGARPFVENRVSSVIQKPKITTTAEQMKPNNNYPPFVVHEGNKVPLHSGGPFGNDAVVFQGTNENLGSLLTNHQVSDIIPTTPEGILSYILKKDPKNKKAQVLLDKMNNNKWGDKQVKEFLMNMLAAGSINLRKIDTDLLPISMLGQDLRMPELATSLDSAGLTQLISATLGNAKDDIAIRTKTKAMSPILTRAAKEYAENAKEQAAQIAAATERAGGQKGGFHGFRGEAPLTRAEIAAYRARGMDPYAPPTPDDIPMIRVFNDEFPTADASGDLLETAAGFKIFDRFVGPKGSVAGTGDAADHAVARTSRHFGIYDAVQSHFQGSWKPDKPFIVSTLSNLMKYNGKPEQLHSNDSFFLQKFGQPFKYSKKEGQLSSVFPLEESAYIKRLTELGLYKQGDSLPIITENPSTKEIFYLAKERYSQSELDQILKEVNNNTNLRPIAQVDDAMRSHPNHERTFGSNDFYMPQRNPYEVDSPMSAQRALQTIAIDKAKKQIGIDQPYSYAVGGEHQSLNQDVIMEIASKLGVRFDGGHNSGDLDMLAKGSGSNPFTYLLNEYKTSVGTPNTGTTTTTKALDALLMWTRFGKYESGKTYPNPSDLKAMQEFIINQYARGFISGTEMDAKLAQIAGLQSKRITGATGGYLSGGKFNIPKFETGINNIPADMLAILHKNEAVVPANMNPFNPNANNATMGGGVYNITNNINGFDGDINALSDMVTRKTVESMKTMSKISVKSMGESRSLGSGLEVRA
jgi:TP901 family phage tail tape measure protein